MKDPNCIFCRIAAGEVPSKKVYEDEDVYAFHDVRPQAPVHLLIIPRDHVATLYDAGMAQHRALGKMLAEHPERAIEYAVKGMLPKTILGRQMFRKLHVFAGQAHPHTAQQPKNLDI